METNESSTIDEDSLKHSKEKKLKKPEEPSKVDQNQEQTNFRRYVLYSHENKGNVHEERESSEGGALGKSTEKNTEGEEQQLTGFLETAAKYFRNCILLLKNKYKNENFGFFETKLDLKIEKNERKPSSEENKESEVNKFSEKFEKSHFKKKKKH